MHTSPTEMKGNKGIQKNNNKDGTEQNMQFTILIN